MKLNTAQAAAVSHGEGPLLVLAGAGSGKTRVLTARIAALIERGDAQPYEILALTFTNKAAQEMRDRAEAMIGPAAQQVTLSTFHSACARWLRRFAGYVGLRPSYTIYDPEDLRQLVRQLATELSAPAESTAVRRYLNSIEAWRNGAVSPREAYERAIGREAELHAELYELLEESLLSLNAVDFGGLITHMINLLESNDRVRQELRAQARYVLVDEFQDTNPAQYRLLKALVDPDGNLCVVGDDDQSIYGWRGARVDHLLGFSKDWEGVKVVILERNYRSTPQILDAAHSLVAPLQNRMAKKLRAARESGMKPHLNICSSDRAEAGWVADQIQEDYRSSDRALSDYAIFYRTNAQSRLFEEALRTRGLAHIIVGGTAFFDRREIRDLIAWARLAANPQDDISLMRAIKAPPRGIGTASLNKLTTIAQTSGESLSQTIERPKVWRAFGKTLRGRLEALASLLQELREVAESSSPAEFFNWLVDTTGYLNWLEGHDPETFEDRRLNIGELVSAAHELVEDSDTPNLVTFLEAITLRSAADDLDEESGAIQLMTVHTSKGLEFPVVFVTGLEDELFPLNTRSRPATPAGLEEEARLGYVAFTRARDELYLSAAITRMKYGQLIQSKPSSLLLCLDDAQYEVVQGSAYQSPTDWQQAGAPRPQRRHAPTDDYDFDQRTSWPAGRFSLVSDLVPEEGILFDDRHSADSEQDSSVSNLAGKSARHNTFGVGKILGAEISAGKVRVSIEFPTVGKKNVILDYLTLI